MKRRTFLQLLGLGVVAPKVVASIPDGKSLTSIAHPEVTSERGGQRDYSSLRFKHHSHEVSGSNYSPFPVNIPPRKGFQQRWMLLSEDRKMENMRYFRRGWKRRDPDAVRIFDDATGIELDPTVYTSHVEEHGHVIGSKFMFLIERPIGMRVPG